MSRESELARCEKWHRDIVDCDLCLDVGIIPITTYDFKRCVSTTIYTPCRVCKNMNYGFIGLEDE